MTTTTLLRKPTGKLAHAYNTIAALEQARADLESENKRLREALTEIKYGLEGARIWGGMEWTYNPLHPFKYLPLIAKVKAALENKP